MSLGQDRVSSRAVRLSAASVASVDGALATARARLHESALELFTTRGFENVTVADLCGHAHIDGVAFARLYVDTHDLFNDVYDAIHDELGVLLLDALAHTRGALLDQIFAGLQTYVHTMLDDPRRMLLVGVESCSLDRAFQAKRRDTRTIFADLIDEMATTHVDRHMIYPGLGQITTLAITASVHELALTWALLPEAARPPLDALIAEAVRLMKAIALAPAL